LQTLGTLLLRLRDGTLPDIPQVRELRRSVEDHCQKTIEGFVDASSRDPQAIGESIMAYEHLGDLHFSSGRVDDSAQALAHAIGLSEQLVAEHASDGGNRAVLGNCHNKLALCLHASGRRTEAIGHFRQARRAYLAAVELDPRSIENVRRLRWFLAICPDARFRDPDRVLSLTAEMIEREEEQACPRMWDPSRSPHWLLRGIAYCQKGDFAAAIDALERPLQSEYSGQGPLYGAGDSGLGWFVLAMAYHRSGHRIRALDCYRNAIRVMDIFRPRDPELMNLRAEAAALLGMADEPTTTGRKEESAPRSSNH
jgi:tetratricopeptide (TPR) repeat protein